VSRAHDAGVRQLTIGFTPNALSEAVPGAMREISRIVPGIEIRLWEGTSDKQIEGLRAGRLDMGFFHPQDFDVSGLEVHVVEKPKTVLAIPEDWPLAAKATLYLSDLDEVPLMLAPSHIQPSLHAMIL